MNMAREEAIRNFREHWASLAITGVDKDHKDDYLKRHGYSGIQDNCFLCEFTDRHCKECPVEWPVTQKDGVFPCCNSYFWDWVEAKTPEERKRLAAIIRDLPEKVEKKEPAPDFKVGDWVKVLEPGYYFPNGHSLLDGKTPDLPQECPVAGKPYEIIAISDNQDSSYGFIYALRSKNNTICQIHHTSSCQKRGLEPTTAPARYQVGDKVVPVRKSIGCSFDQHMMEVGGKKKYFIINEIRDNGDIWLNGGKYRESDLIPYVEKPKNHAPENKTFTECGATFILNGPVTVCIIDVDGRKFKGIAKCAPEDAWDESVGKGWAGLRAMQKLLKATEKNLKRNAAQTAGWSNPNQDG